MYDIPLSGGAVVSALNKARSVPSILVTDPAYGAVGNYTGTQNTAGVGTDARAAIQAALDAAYTQGSSYGDTTHNVSKYVKVPAGKYYISAPSDGTPSLKVPLGVVLDLREAELHFDKPPLTYNSNTEPNPLWCGILVGPLAHLILGRLQMKPDQDQTYGGTWFGMHLDAIRVQESDTFYIIGAGKDNMILGFRGAAIRPIACLNGFVSGIKIWANCFGIVQSYFGTAFDGSVTGTGYTRYRGTSHDESICVALYVNRCTFLNIYKKGILSGVNGNYTAQGTWTSELGGLETITTSKVGGGPLSVSQCSFENIAEEVIFAENTGAVSLEDVRIERSGAINTLGTITAALCNVFSLSKVTWQQEGGTCFKASYTGALASFTPNPGAFVRVNSTNVSPSLRDIYINNTASVGCQLVKGDNNITRLPVVKNYETGTAAQMQGTDAYMQSIIIENDGGREWGVSVTGLTPTEAINGSRTVFNFPNGFTRQKPKRIIVDGVVKEATDVAGTNWTWTVGAGTDSTVTFATAPAKSVRAFF